MKIECFAIAHFDTGIAMRCAECKKVLETSCGYFVVMLDVELVTYLVWSPRGHHECCQKSQAVLLHYDTFDEACDMAGALALATNTGFEFTMAVHEYSVPRDKIVLGYPDGVT